MLASNCSMELIMISENVSGAQFILSTVLFKIILKEREGVTQGEKGGHGQSHVCHITHSDNWAVVVCQH